MTEKKSEDINLGILIPCLNEEKVLSKTIEKILIQVNKMKEEKLISSVIICLVDDGSTDQTWSKFLELKEKCSEKLICIKFSKNFGHQFALHAGITYLSNLTDCIISIDADLEQDESAMLSFVKQYLDGNEIVLGVRTNRNEDSFFKKTTAVIFFKITKLLGINFVYNHADYRLISKRVAQEIAKFQEHHLYLRAMILDMGFKQSKVYYEVKRDKIRSSRYSLFKMLSLATNGITSFSINPLRISAVTGLLTMIFSFLMILIIFYEKLYLGVDTPGWASTVLPIYFIGGLNMLFLGLIGEYVGKIFIEVKKRPRYIIDKIT